MLYLKVPVNAQQFKLPEKTGFSWLNLWWYRLSLVRSQQRCAPRKSLVFGDGWAWPRAKELTVAREKAGCGSVWWWLFSEASIEMRTGRRLSQAMVLHFWRWGWLICFFSNVMTLGHTLCVKCREFGHAWECNIIGWRIFHGVISFHEVAGIISVKPMDSAGFLEPPSRALVPSQVNVSRGWKTACRSVARVYHTPRWSDTDRNPQRKTAQRKLRWTLGLVSQQLHGNLVTQMNQSLMRS